MNQRDLANNYLKYFAYAGGLADNAPTSFRTWMSQLPKTVDRYLVHNALETLAGKTPAAHDATYIATWFAYRPLEVHHIDAVLRSKKPPTTFAELMGRSFKEAQQAVVDTVRTFLKSQLPQD